MTTTTVAMGESWSWGYTLTRLEQRAKDLVRRVNERLPGSARWRPVNCELVYDIRDLAVGDDLVSFAEAILADEYRRAGVEPPGLKTPGGRVVRGKRRSMEVS